MDLVTEHNIAPGTLYENCLLFDGGSAVLNEMDLHEASEHGSTVLKFKGKFQEAESVNKNKRMYPYSILDSNVKRLEETMDAGGLVGELDHPTDSIVHFANASHKIVRLWWENKKIHLSAEK